ncbi:MAG TPA: FeoA family protein [Gemmatimonadales bacterium]|nr:FeoA family protein [Gemmatimonadales bacterium]
MKCTMCGTAPSGCDGCPIGSNFFLSHSLAGLQPGQRGTVRRLAAENPADLRKLLALGLLPGVEVEVERHWPAVVLRVDSATVALDAGLAGAVIVALAA